MPEGEAMLPVWHYTEYPRVVAVAPGGAAERAGVREGDVLKTVDGMSVLSPEGARRFSSARVGDEIHLTFDRGGKTVDLELSPRFGRGFGMRGDRPMREPVPREYSGRVGDATIDVTSDDPVVATTDASGMLTLRIGGTIVRIRPTQAPPERTKSSKSGHPEKSASSS
jgi:membrane-associated protease RseP (regulator of RpoE activity)